jgi:hypothetical protein
MKSYKLLILLIVLCFLLPDSFSRSQGFANHGAHIFTASKTYIRVNNFDFKNLSGFLNLRFDSEFKTTNNSSIFNSGTFFTDHASHVTADGDFTNTASVTISGTSTISVKKNVINTGGIYNGHIIEIGQ